MCIEALQLLPMLEKGLFEYPVQCLNAVSGKCYCNAVKEARNNHVPGPINYLFPYAAKSKL